MNPRPCSNCGRMRACLLMVEFLLTGQSPVYICTDCLEEAGKVVLMLEEGPEPAA